MLVAYVTRKLFCKGMFVHYRTNAIMYIFKGLLVKSTIFLTYLSILGIMTFHLFLERDLKLQKVNKAVGDPHSFYTKLE